MFGRGTLFCAGAAVASRLGASAFADFSYLALTSATLTAYFSVGAGTAITRYVAIMPEARAASGNAPLAAAALLGVLGGVLALALLAAFPGAFMPNSVIHLKAPLMAAFAAQMLGGMTLSALAGRRQFVLAACANLCGGVVLIITALFGILKNAPVVVIWAIPASQFSLLLVTTVAAWKLVFFEAHGVGLRAAFRHMSAVLKFAAPMFVISLLASSGPWALSLLLVRSDKAEFAAFSAGLQWFSLVLVIPGAVSSAYLPRLFQQSSMGHSLPSAQVNYTIRANVLQSLFIALAVAVVILPLAPILLRFHGEVLRGRISTFAAFVFTGVLAAVTNPIGNGLVARNGQLTWLRLTFVWLAAVLLTALLGGRATAFSASLDLCAGYVVLLGMSMPMLRSAAAR